MTTTPIAAGWYEDPTRRHEYRYWDGAVWGESVSDRGMTAQDPFSAPPPAPAPSPAPHPVAQTARKPRWRRKRDEKLIESARPHLQQGEEVREIFMGVLSVPVVGGWWWSRKRLVVVTDRSVYVFSKGHASFSVKALLFEARLGEVAAHCGFGWSLKVDDCPRVYTNLDSGVGVRKRVAAMINEAVVPR